MYVDMQAVHVLGNVYILFEAISLVQGSSSNLGWLASKPRGFACFDIFSSGIISTTSLLWTVFSKMGLRHWAWVLRLAMLVLY